MKKILIASSMILIFANCSSPQNKAMEDQKRTNEIIASTTPAMIPVSATGFYMTAKVDGKDWTATSMQEPDFADRIRGNYEDEYIGLPYRGKNMKAGDIVKFSNHPILLSLSGVELDWDSQEGELVITKAGDNFLEGTFFFTAVSHGGAKIIKVTDGAFRILTK